MAWASNSKVEKKTENVCSYCGLIFRSWDELHNHKLKAKDHITCPKCSQDFNTQEGFRLHHVQMHSAEQDLFCEKCNQRFTRVGGLVGHIENGQCDLISKAIFGQTLLENQKKEDDRDDRERQRTEGMYGQTAGGFGNNSPAVQAGEGIKYYQPETVDLKSKPATPSITDNLQESDEDPHDYGVALEEDDNLISFASSAILNSPWGQPVPLPSRVDNGQKVTPRVTQTSFSTNAPMKAESSPPNVRAVPSGHQLSPNQIPPHLRHLYPGTRLSISTENHAGGDAADTVSRFSGTFTNSDSTSYNQVQHPIPSDLQQSSMWSGDAGLAYGQLEGFAPNRSTNGQRNIASAANSGFVSKNPMDFPALQTQKIAKSTQNIMDTLNMEPKKEVVAWATEKYLFPDAPAAVAPSVELMASLTVSPPEELNPFDPSTPGFNVMKFWVSFTKKFKCPYKGCKKSLETGPAFTQHLRSAAHRDDKLRCSTCLRYFATATALTQHSESQGNRCKAREQTLYNDEVEKFTAGVAAVGGLHKDETLKYVLGPTLNPAIEAARAAQKADTEAFGDELEAEHATRAEQAVTGEVDEEFNVLDRIKAANASANNAKAKRFQNYWVVNKPKW